MSNGNRAGSNQQWSTVQAYTLAVVCLLLGIAGGWLLRGSSTPGATASASSSTSPMPSAADANPASTAPTPEQMKQMADTQAAPLLEKLKANPNDAGLLQNIGNMYYDAQQFPTAIDYYQRALKVEPANTSARTDMATAYWYMGNADTAIAEFQKSLAYDPNKADTLLNLGVVEWQGKMDIDKAVATWQKLLDTNPNYPGKDKVLELMAQAKRHSGVKAGTPAKPLPQGTN